MRRHASLIASCLFSLFVAGPQQAARADGPADTVMSVDSGTITYHLVHKFHKIDATSKKIEGKARLLSDGKVQVGLRSQVESFDSGNANRDEHMKEVAETTKFPTVELKAVGTGLTPPTSFPATLEKKFQGELTFHGVKKNIEVPVTVTFESPGKVKTVSHFSINLEEYKIERPSLLFVKVDDALAIDVDIMFKG